MDVSLIIGVVFALASLLMGFMLEGGKLLSLMLLSPLIIVLGGTIGAVVASFSFQDIAQAFKTLRKTFNPKASGDPDEIIQTIADLSDASRRDGINTIENCLTDPALSGEQYLLFKEGLILILERKTVDEIRYILDADIRAYVMQKQVEINVFESAGGFSPTLGIIGTVLGLIQVLSNFSSPEELTSSIAVAFVATLYGVSFANLIYFPMANKIKVYLKRQRILKEMIMDGVCMIANGAFSRSVKNELSLYYNAFPDGSSKYIDNIEN
ncbi:motility protein A [Aminipila luticellarii]|uniref:Biopolymer transporter ExbB n=1 Tax=Aminipila luticellarii TaxID=2507160 RepID=A0A410PY32_9FIRM|nr:MotA/TolQ/ExbB proton channel family protein [Aminipila luticellarii]QAT43848.1 biopolymer transporter ExbB [Aminipila luticellarii]